jgi:hypothetical protein
MPPPLPLVVVVVVPPPDEVPPPLPLPLPEPLPLPQSHAAKLDPSALQTCEPLQPLSPVQATDCPGVQPPPKAASSLSQAMRQVPANETANSPAKKVRIDLLRAGGSAARRPERISHPGACLQS